MLPSTRSDVWRLSPAVRMDVDATARRDLDAQVGDDPLANFRPKDAGEYVAQIEGRTINKRREHERVLSEYGLAASLLGWRPSTDVHPRDLELARETARVLVEVKQIAQGNSTKAVREAVSQLLEYSYYFYPAKGHHVRKLAVFSEPIGSAHAEYLSSLQIAAVWIDDDLGWDGNSLSKQWALLPNESARTS